MDTLFCFVFCFFDCGWLVFLKVSGLSNLWFLITQTVLGMGCISWSGLPVKSDIDWLLLQVLCHHCYSISYTEDRF